jgi:hypothetical protein
MLIFFSFDTRSAFTSFNYLLQTNTKKNLLTCDRLKLFYDTRIYYSRNNKYNENEIKSMLFFFYDAFFDQNLFDYFYQCYKNSFNSMYWIEVNMFFDTDHFKNQPTLYLNNTEVELIFKTIKQFYNLPIGNQFASFEYQIKPKKNEQPYLLSIGIFFFWFIMNVETVLPVNTFIPFFSLYQKYLIYYFFYLEKFMVLDKGTSDFYWWNLLNIETYVEISPHQKFNQWNQKHLDSIYSLPLVPLSEGFILEILYSLFSDISIRYSSEINQIVVFRARPGFSLFKLFEIQSQLQAFIQKQKRFILRSK